MLYVDQVVIAAEKVSVVVAVEEAEEISSDGNAGSGIRYISGLNLWTMAVAAALLVLASVR